MECMSYSSPLGEPCWAPCRVARGSNTVAQFVFGSTRLFVLLKFPLPTAWWHNPLRNLSAVLNSSKLPVFCPNRIIFYVQRNWPVGLLGACQQCCYWQTVPPQWGGGRLFDGSAIFFYGDSCNSGTESRKIVPKVGN